MIRDTLDLMEQGMKKAVESSRRSFSTVRTGKASPSIIEGIKINVYDQKMTLKQIGTVHVRDARSLTVHVWDGGLVKEVEKAIAKAGMGLQTMSEGQTIKVTTPILTEDQRKEYVKVVKKLAEESKISLRNQRREAIQAFDKASKEKVITDDDVRGARKEADRVIHKHEKIIESLFEKKKSEIMEV